MTDQSTTRLAKFVSVVAVGAIASLSAAQVTPNRTYYGVNRAIPMTISVPDGIEGDPRIALLAPGTADLIAESNVLAGEVDLAGLFPSLWESSRPTVQYAQLVVGETKVGPAVVLQPMLTPAYAAQVDQTGFPKPIFARSPEIFSGYRAYPDQHVVFETDKGEIEFRMRPDQAPNTVWNFMHLAEGGFYTDIIVHRIVPAVNSPSGPKPFVIQAGDPIGVGNGGPGYYIDLEPSKLPHDFGVISMARSGDPNSNGSQIFVCLSREGTMALDTRYTAFGEAVAGADTIVTISQVPLTDEPNSQQAKEPPVIKRAYLVDAPPYGQGPKPVGDPTKDTSR